MLTLSIQAGGQSTRMGRDKTLMPFLGQPLIQRVMNRTAHIADEILITSNEPGKLRFLGIDIVPDLMPDTGALGGLYTALKTAKHPLVALVACDLPFANPILLTACRDILVASSSDAVIPSSTLGLEPLHAIYRRDTCMPRVEAALLAGKRKVIAWHPGAQIQILPPEHVSQYDPHGYTFINVNTPLEFRHAERKARQIEPDTD